MTPRMGGSGSSQLSSWRLLPWGALSVSEPQNAHLHIGTADEASTSDMPRAISARERLVEYGGTRHLSYCGFMGVSLDCGR